MVVIDVAGNAIDTFGTTFFLDADHPHFAFEIPLPMFSTWIMEWDFQSAFQNLAGHERDGCQAVETVAAQILCGGRDDFRELAGKEQDWPVDPDAGPLPAFGLECVCSLSLVRHAGNSHESVPGVRGHVNGEDGCTFAAIEKNPNNPDTLTKNRMRPKILKF
jgi:hypothetical protein